MSDLSKIENSNFITINDYFDRINNGLSKYKARIIGEVIEVTLYPGRSYLFFKIKDKNEDNTAVLNCMMWKRDYDLSGIEIEIGMEIIITGSSNIYKKEGRFSFSPKVIELVGEGALKIAYDKLKNKLEKEGLFNEDIKKPVANLPEKIGLITSRDGAVINDFLNNIGKFGFKINFIDSRVEGVLAVEELISAIDKISKEDIDVLVIIRGGGSLESMQAFNNEALVRKIAEFKKPVICGIGHDKDIPLASLVADISTSTPTAAANFLNKSWEELFLKLTSYEKVIVSRFSESIQVVKEYIPYGLDVIKGKYQVIFLNFHKADESLNLGFKVIKDRIFNINKELQEALSPVYKKMNYSLLNLNEELKNNIPHNIISEFNSLKNKIQDDLLNLEKNLNFNDPKRQLKLGYSIVMKNGILLKDLKNIKAGDIINVNLNDGNFDSEVKRINK